jgi:hypothetical protein
VAFLVTVLLAFILGGGVREYRTAQLMSEDTTAPLSSAIPQSLPDVADPTGWLKNNIRLPHHAYTDEEINVLEATRPKAALVSLVTPLETDRMLGTVTELEARFNARTARAYDWVFFSPASHTEEFMESIRNVTSAHCRFEVIPEAHWSTPEFVDRGRFDALRQLSDKPDLTKSAWETYHHMRRWNAGYFALEDGLKDYEWFWRIEPGVSVYTFLGDNA